MRITPTCEQMKYLTSVGISETTLSQPVPVTEHLPEISHKAAGNSGCHAGQWWGIFLVIVVLLLSIVAIAHGGELQAVEQSSVASADQVWNQWLNMIDVEITLLREWVSRAAMQEELAVLQGQLESLEQRLATFQDTYLNDNLQDHGTLTHQIESIQIDQQDLRSNLTARSGELTTSITEKVGAQITEAGRASEELTKRDMDTLRWNLNQQRQDFNMAVVWLATICTLIVGLIVTGRILMEKSIGQVEQDAISRLSETAVINGDIAKPLQASGEGVGLAAKLDKKVKIELTRPKPQPLPSPLEQMQAIIASANRFHHIRAKPALSSESWGIGLATDKGFVRLENQDFGLIFKINGHDVLIVADGCGGLPHGQRAAYLAATSAAVSIVRAYGTAPRWYSPNVKDVAAKAILDAAHPLAVQGDKLNITDIRLGLRTTLIVVIGNKSEVGYAYIGDGGGCVVKATGEVNRFLDPQKANDFAMNVLAASLGPVMEGEPVTGLIKREAGDLLVVGTDGIFDRVDQGFPKDVLRGCIEYNGDLQMTAERIVAELASFKDSAGYICDDNLTLGIMGDGTAPRLPPGFWSPGNGSNPCPTDISQKKVVSGPERGIL